MAKDIKIQILGDASKFKSAIADASASSDHLTSKTKSNGEEMSKFGLGALGVGAAIGVGLFKAGEAASNLGESVNAVKVTFGTAADGILKLGDDAATSVGLSTVAFNGLAVQFSSFATTIAGKGGDVVGTMKDMTGRAADFASVMNIEVADAAAMFQSGLAGETEPLKKFGLDLSAAAVSAYAAANGIGETGKQLTEAEKVAARYGLLMQQTAKDQGDFANTSDSAANATRIAKAEMENAAASLGQVVAPVMAEVAGKAAMLAKGFVSLNEASGGALLGFTAFAGGTALVIGAVTSVIGRVQKLKALMYDSEGQMTSTGKVMNGLIPIAAVVGVTMFAMGQRSKQAAEHLAAVGDAAQQLSKVADAAVFDEMVRAIAEGSLAGKDLSETFKILAQANIEGAERALAMAEAQGVDEKVTIALRRAIADQIQAAKEAGAAHVELATEIDNTATVTDGLTIAQKAAKGATDGLKAAQEEAARKADAFSQSLQGQLDKLAELYPKEYDAVVAKYDYAKQTEETMLAVDAMNKTLGDHKSKQEDVKAATDNARDSIIDQAEKFAGLDGAAAGSEGSNRRLIKSLEDQAATLAPGSPLRDYLLQYIADLKTIPEHVKTMLDLHINSDATNKNAPGYSAGKPYASGTDSATPGPHLVGEHGPEVVNFAGGETVTPNSALGGVSIGEVHVHVQSMPTPNELIALVKKYEARNGPGWRT